MKTLEDIRGRIASVGDMRSVVATMKTLAATSIRQFETAVAATRKFDETIQLALHVLLRNRDLSLVRAGHPTEPQEFDAGSGIIVLGSDQGLCGRFNEAIAAKVASFLRLVNFPRQPAVITIGHRVNAPLDDCGISVIGSHRVPATETDIVTVLQDIMPQIEQWQTQLGMQRIDVFYNRRTSSATYESHHYPLLPISTEFLNRIQQRNWPSRSLPIYSLSWKLLFSEVVRQYLFLQLYRACAESRASENASRIASMQQAEKNIDQRMSELQLEFNLLRQRSITEELMDIISGFDVAREIKHGRD